MVLEDRYCDEIMIQISAINKSLKSLGTEMLKNHLQTCIVDELKNDNLSAIDDVISLFDKLNQKESVVYEKSLDNFTIIGSYDITNS